MKHYTDFDSVSDLFPPKNIVPFDSFDGIIKAFKDGTCNVLAGERFSINRETLEGWYPSWNSTGYQLGNNTFSKDPIAIVTREGDVQWSELVNLIVNSLLVAEKQNVTMKTAKAFSTTALVDPAIKDMMVRAIDAVGNYGEMYARHLESLVPREPVHNINIGGSESTGLLYDHPFGDMTNIGLDMMINGTLEQIRNRHHLRCGVTILAGFGEPWESGNNYRGLDADYCRALSAAIFGNVTDNTVVFVKLNDSAEGFKALANETVDVLSGGSWDLETYNSSFAFSPVYFYNTSQTM